MDILIVGFLDMVGLKVVISQILIYELFLGFYRGVFGKSYDVDFTYFLLYVEDFGLFKGFVGFYWRWFGCWFCFWLLSCCSQCFFDRLYCEGLGVEEEEEVLVLFLRSFSFGRVIEQGCVLLFFFVMSGELRRGFEQESGRVRVYVSEGWRRELERVCKRFYVIRMGYQFQVVKVYIGVMRVFCDCLFVFVENKRLVLNRLKRKNRGVWVWVWGAGGVFNQIVF